MVSMKVFSPDAGVGAKLPPPLKLPPLLRLITVLLVLSSLPVPVAVFPQEGESLSRFAPSVPLPEGPLESIVLRHMPVGNTGTAPVRIVRHGFPGSTARPNMLDVPPDDGSFIEVHSYDWLRVRHRQVEFRTQGTFLPLVTLNPEAQVLVVSDRRLELLHGSLQWQRRHSDAPEYTVAAGSVAISGRGEASVERGSREITVTVHSGRISIAVDGEVTAVVGAGQTRKVPFPSSSGESGVSGASEPVDFEAALQRLRTTLDEALLLIHADNLSDTDLAELWAQVVPVTVLFSELETATDSSVPNPDIVMRDIGEAFRILGGYRFEPSPSFKRS